MESCSNGTGFTSYPIRRMGLEYECRSCRTKKRSWRRRGGNCYPRKKDRKLGRQREEHHRDRKGHRVYEGKPRSDRAAGDVEMNSALLLLSLATAAPECDDLKRDMQALEIFLQDKADKEEFCPNLNWEQPDISVYKKELKSQLPEGCKK